MLGSVTLMEKIPQIFMFFYIIVPVSIIFLVVMKQAEEFKPACILAILIYLLMWVFRYY